MNVRKLVPFALLFAPFGCAQLIDLSAYETGSGGQGGSTKTGGAGGTTSSTQSGGSGGTASTSEGGATQSSTSQGGATTSTSEGGGTSSSSMTFPECEPGTKEPCYEGPPQTQGIGLCKPGERQCDASGFWGACLNQVLPQVEDCKTPSKDENCDNLSSCSGAFRWAKRFGGAGAQVANDVAVDSTGNVWVIGTASGALDLGGGPLQDGGGEDIFFAKFGSNGKHLWSKRFGGIDDQLGVAIAVDGSDNVAIAATVRGAGVDAGGGALPNAGSSDILVAKYSSDGAHLWSKTFGFVGQDGAGDLAIEPLSGDVLVGGIDGASMAGDIYLLRLAAGTGEFSISITYNHSGFQTVDGIAADGQGGFYVLAHGADGVAGAFSSFGLSDVFLGRYTGNGLLTWGKLYGGDDDDFGLALARDPNDGSVIIVGHSSGVMNVGLGASLPPAGSLDVCLWKVDATGVTQWGNRYGDAGAQFGFGVAVDGGSNIVAAGTFAGTISFNAPMVAGPAIYDRFLVKFGPSGTTTWQRQFANGAGALPRVAVDALGNIAMVSSLLGTVDFGGGPLTATETDLVVATFAP